MRLILSALVATFFAVKPTFSIEAASRPSPASFRIEPAQITPAVVQNLRTLAADPAGLDKVARLVLKDDFTRFSSWFKDIDKMSAADHALCSQILLEAAYGKIMGLHASIQEALPFPESVTMGQLDNVAGQMREVRETFPALFQLLGEKDLQQLKQAMSAIQSIHEARARTQELDVRARRLAKIILGPEGQDARREMEVQRIKDQLMPPATWSPARGGLSAYKGRRGLSEREILRGALSSQVDSEREMALAARMREAAVQNRKDSPFQKAVLHALRDRLREGLLIDFYKDLLARLRRELKR